MRTQAKGEEVGMGGGRLPIVKEASLKRRVETRREGVGGVCSPGKWRGVGGACPQESGEGIGRDTERRGGGCLPLKIFYPLQERLKGGDLR